MNNLTLDFFETYPIANDISLTAVEETLRNAKSWESRYREIMLLGKQLPKLSDELKTSDYLVKGCESNVWLHYVYDSESEKYHFAADSDAKIVKGLVLIVLVLFNKKTESEIADLNYTAFFNEIDLLKHLSASRSNGITAIIQQIKAIAVSK